MGGKWSFSRIFEVVFQSLASDFEIEPAGGCRGRPTSGTAGRVARLCWPPLSHERHLTSLSSSWTAEHPPSSLLPSPFSSSALLPGTWRARPWLPQQGPAPSTLAARHLQPSEHPVPCPSSRRPPASLAGKYRRRGYARQPPRPAAVEQLLAAAGQGQSQVWPWLATPRVSHPFPRRPLPRRR